MPPKENNFDLIRIFAAMQVLIEHALWHLQLKTSSIIHTLSEILNNFPGVPIFFSLSGMLIYWSFDRNSNKIFSYFKNRFLRLYPALWVCFIFTFIVLIYFGFINAQNITSNGILAWIATQISFLQFYTPEALRGFGLSNPNGNLWTICIEIQYYLFVPIFYLLFKNTSLTVKNIAISLLVLLSLIANYFIKSLNQELITTKLLGVFLLPYLFYFLIGVLIYINWKNTSKYFENKFLISFILFITYFSIFNLGLKYYTPSYWPNIFGLTATVLLIYTTFCFAFTYNTLGHTLLKGNDISYGVYIYSGILINIFVQLKLTHSIKWFIIYTIITIVISFISWKIIEKPALKMK